MIPRRVWLVAGTFCLSVLLYVDRVAISAAEDDIARDLALDEKQMGWVFSAFALGYALFQTPGGHLADRLGPRRVLTAVVSFWSLFTGLTGAARGFFSLLTARFLFGAGEAPAFPGLARATYSWIPMRERGLVQGINFSGSRLGAAFALPVVAWAVATLGWRATFWVLMGIGFAWAVFWWRWFRDDPATHPGMSERERELILSTRQGGATEGPPGRLPARAIASSPGVWLIAAQYFASNFTFFFALSWLLPHIKSEYDLDGVEAGFWVSVPFLGGAAGNWVSGVLVDRLYASGRWRLSRRLPAVIGYALAAAGLLLSLQAETVFASIAFFSVAIFGADMTLPPSWSVCIDVGGRHAGVVSGTMNMAGNFGSFLTALAFPHLQEWWGPSAFFWVAAGLDVAAIGAWFAIAPDRRLEPEGRLESEGAGSP